MEDPRLRHLTKIGPAATTMHSSHTVKIDELPSHPDHKWLNRWLIMTVILWLDNYVLQQKLSNFYSLTFVFSFDWQNIPRKFGNRHFDLDKKRGDIYLVLNKGVWPAKYLIRMTLKGPHFDLTTGWKAFAKDNDLKVGDVCKFELISSTILTFIVHIFRETGNDNTNCSTSQSRNNWSLVFISNYL